MNEKRCLYCYQPLGTAEGDYHEKCSRTFFGTPVPPVLEYEKDQMQELAKEIVIRSIAVTGVQPKISLEIVKSSTDTRSSRFTIVGLWGSYILKPPTEMFPHLPANEDLTMHLSKLCGIPTASHSLIRLKSGELAYITKRFDRTKKEKLALEDMCQLTETLTEDKYRGSMEKVGKHIVKYSSRPGLDLVVFFDLVLFSFLTGNADMHLKNFALLTTQGNEVVLSPAYDLLCTKLAMPEDTEEMALTINGRKRKLKKDDFLTLAKTLGIPEKAIQNSFERLARKLTDLSARIDISFLPDAMKQQYKEFIALNAVKLEL